MFSLLLDCRLVPWHPFNPFFLEPMRIYVATLLVSRVLALLKVVRTVAGLLQSQPLVGPATVSINIALSVEHVSCLPA